MQSRIKDTCHGVKGCGVSTLERVNGLFFIPHNKDGALQGAGPFATAEFLGEFVNHIPLLRAGVLGFIDQNVIHAAIQAEQHPIRHGRFPKEKSALLDEVIKIQPSPSLLLVGIKGQKHRGEVVQGHGAVGGSQAQTLGSRLLNPLHQCLQWGQQEGDGFA